MKKKKALGIDLRTFTGDYGGGKDQFAYNLLKGLYDLNYPERIVCFCDSSFIGYVQQFNPLAEAIALPHKKQISWLPLSLNNLIGKILDDFTELRYLRKENIRLLFFTNKFSSTFPFLIPSMVVTHDVQPLIRPENFGKLFRLFIKIEFFMRKLVIAISDFDLLQLRSICPYTENKSVRIYDPVCFRKYESGSINKNKIIAINIFHPHKNISTIVDAFIELAKTTQYDFLIVGQLPRGVEQYVDHIEQSGFSSRIRFTGFVSDDRMSDIFANTRLFINASSFEGFGLAAVEMMGSGIQVVVPDNSAQREVTKNKAIYYQHAESSDELIEAISYALKHPVCEDELAEISNSVRQQYNYLTVTKEYIQLFDRYL